MKINSGLMQRLNLFLILCMLRDRFLQTISIKKDRQDYISSIHRSNSGETWVGTLYGDLIRVEDKTGVEQFKFGDYITAICDDHNSNLWIGTGGCRLMRYKDGKLLLLEDTTNQPVFDIYRILEDEAGYLWMSSNIGICRAKHKQLNNLIDKKTGDLNLNVFGVSDGLNSAECTGNSYNSAIKQENGEFWFATKKGIAVFQPEKVEINKQAPNVFIENMTVNGESLTLRPSKNSFAAVDSIRFQFTAPTFIPQERVYFKFKLENYDKEWLMCII